MCQVALAEVTAIQFSLLQKQQQIPYRHRDIWLDLRNAMRLDMLKSCQTKFSLCKLGRASRTS